MLDIGGGFPAHHEGAAPDLADYGHIIGGLVGESFGDLRPELVLEPGRGIVGDAELDEGNIFEAILEGWKQGLRNCWWIIDYNRQSLDAVVSDRLFTRLDTVVPACVRVGSAAAVDAPGTVMPWRPVPLSPTSRRPWSAMRTRCDGLGVRPFHPRDLAVAGVLRRDLPGSVRLDRFTRPRRDLHRTPLQHPDHPRDVLRWHGPPPVSVAPVTHPHGRITSATSAWRRVRSAQPWLLIPHPPVWRCAHHSVVRSRLANRPRNP